MSNVGTATDANGHGVHRPRTRTLQHTTLLARTGSNSYLMNMKYEYSNRKSRVGERGQVTIPKELRTRYGVKPGNDVVFEERKDGLLIKRIVREDPLRELVGRIRDDVDVDRYLEQTRGPAWNRELDEE